MKQIILPVTVHLNIRLPLALLQPEPADAPTGPEPEAHACQGCGSCRWTENWKRPCSTAWTPSVAPSAGRCSPPAPTGPNTARNVLFRYAAAKRQNDSGKDTTFLRI